MFAFPSSVDVAHFARARQRGQDPVDQQGIPHPRLGFFGVIDERLNVGLLEALARERPTWHLILLGPVAKIDPGRLPRGPNVHYLGPKPYADLPAYLSGWDVALLPFARNETTRFISPTKTPEYLAAGKPVVSTSIRDVVRSYGDQGVVRIADAPDEFIEAIEATLIEQDDGGARQARIDELLRDLSWDRTWSEMQERIAHAVDAVAVDGGGERSHV